MNWVFSTGNKDFNAANGSGLPGQSETATLIDNQGVAAMTVYRTSSGVYALKMGGDIGTAAAGVTVVQHVSGSDVTLDITLLNFLVTLVKNGTTSGGGGATLFTFNKGIVGPFGGSSNLTVKNALDKSFLAGVGSAASGTDGTLTGTEISFLPQTAATTSSGAGTCKMKPTSTTPTPGGKLDGTSTAVAVILNACLNADATGAESLFFSGTIRISCSFEGTN